MSRRPPHPFAPGVIVRCRPVSRFSRVPRSVWFVGAVMLAALLAAGVQGVAA